MSFSHHRTQKRFSSTAESEAAEGVQNLMNGRKAIKEIQTWPEYEPQPLHSMNGLARQIAVANLYSKDESKRFGTDLGSFQALGAPHAVPKALQNEVKAKLGVVVTSTVR